MSTIASPREPARRNPSQQNLATPTSSTRPSLDVPRSAAGSPNPNANTFSPGGSTGGAVNKKNRAALREYYNLRNPAVSTPPAPPSVEITDPVGDQHEISDVPPSAMDKDGFDADAFVKNALAEHGMEELLRLYTRTLGEIRALDAEKKALVYDNYSKLITATETIRKVGGRNIFLDLQNLLTRPDEDEHGPLKPHGVDAGPGHCTNILTG
jgi:vacuolar protein sorting-associated protein 51